MNKRNRIYLCVVFVFFVINLFAQISSSDDLQNRTIDSLKMALNTTKVDTTKCQILRKMISKEQNDYKARSYMQQIMDICEQKLMKKDLNQEQVKVFKGNYAGALSDYAHSLYALGDVKKAIELNLKVLKIEEEIGNETGIGQSLNNLGVIYLEMGDRDKGIEYFKKGLALEEKKGNKIGVGNILGNIGLCYRSDNNLEKAIEYLNSSLQILTEINAYNDMAYVLTSLAGTYNLMGDKKKAIELYQKSLNLSRFTGDKFDEANTVLSIGIFYLKNKEFEKALAYLKEAKQLAKNINNMKRLKNVYNNLYRTYKSLGDDRAALENYENYIELNDSINSESNRKASIKSQLKYEYEKQAAADSVAHAKESEIKNAELAKQKAEIKAKKNQQYALFGGLFCVCVFGVFMYNRFKVTQKQKGIIEEQKSVVEEQKKLVEEKQKEILDSIHYARRIQMAQIPSESRVRRILKSMNKQTN